MSDVKQEEINALEAMRATTETKLNNLSKELSIAVDHLAVLEQAFDEANLTLSEIDGQLERLNPAPQVASPAPEVDEDLETEDESDDE